MSLQFYALLIEYNDLTTDRTFARVSILFIVIDLWVLTQTWNWILLCSRILKHVELLNDTYNLIIILKKVKQ